MPRSDPYPPIGDYGLIGDCHTAALISREASIEWCCLPRFDSGSTFGRMLDRRRGGHCSITPVVDGDWEYSRRYLEDSLVLETTLHGPDGEHMCAGSYTDDDLRWWAGRVREWQRMGHRVTIAAASFSHMRTAPVSVTGAVTEEEIDGIRYLWLKTPPYRGNGASRAALDQRLQALLLRVPQLLRLERRGERVHQHRR